MQSHLYRAPLARIMSLIDVVKEDKFNADFAREKALRYLTESAEELDTLIREITEKTAGANLP
jgi:signal transduction histidine kinase